MRKLTSLVATDSAILAPPQNQRFSLTNVSWLLDTGKRTLLKEKYPYIFSCVQRSIDQ